MIIHTARFIPNAEDMFKELRATTPWIRRENTPRAEFHFNAGGMPFTYGRGSGIRTYFCQPITAQLQALKEIVEQHLNVEFEGVSANLYCNGSEHVGWHADDAPQMRNDKPIVTVSFGASRIFAVKSLDKIDPQQVAVELQSGDLLVMPAGMQQTHVHKVLKSNTPDPRICVVFRGIHF